ncbi:hypothetical protein [Aeromonas hydrophila]
MRVVWSLLYFFSVLALAGPVLVKEQKKVADPLIVPYQQYMYRTLSGKRINNTV